MPEVEDACAGWEGHLGRRELPFSTGGDDAGGWESSLLLHMLSLVCDYTFSLFFFFFFGTLGV